MPKTSVPFNQHSRALLQKVPFFSKLSDESLIALAQSIVVKTVEAEEILFLEGEPPAGLHIVVAGQLKIYRLSPDGRENVMIILRPGDSCNEVPAVDGNPNAANVSAMTHSTVWIIPNQAIDKLRIEYPMLNEYIIQNLARRARQLVGIVHERSFSTVPQRLARFLINHSDGGGTLQRREWTQDRIAAGVGAVRETTARCLKQMKNQGLIDLNRQTIRIIDPDALESIIRN